METRAQKWGNSLAVRISKGVAQKAGVSVDDTLEVDVDVDGAIVLTPRRRRKYRLNDLLKGITKKNVHADFDFWPPVGGEIW